MAIIFNNYPLGLTPTNGDHTWTLFSSLTGQTNFRYVADIWINPYESTSEKVARIKIQPNSYGRGIFNVEDILKNYILPNPRNGNYGATNTTQYPTEGLITNNNDSYLIEANALNNSSDFEYLLHIGEYRIMFGEQYEVGGTTTLVIPTDPSLPLSTFSAYTSSVVASYSGDPNTINWVNAGGAIRAGQSLNTGYVYYHYTSSGVLVSSGTSSSLSGLYTSSASPFVNDSFYVEELYSGIRYNYIWKCSTCELSGWNFVGLTRPVNAASQPEALTIWPGTQDNLKTFNYDKNWTTNIGLGGNATEYWKYYEGYKYEFHPYSQRNEYKPSQFLSTFGDNYYSVTKDAVGGLNTQETFPVRRRNHHYKCPIVLGFFVGKNGLFSNELTYVKYYTRQDKQLNYGGGTGTSLNNNLPTYPQNTYLNVNKRLYYVGGFPEEFGTGTNGKILLYAHTGTTTQGCQYTGSSVSEAVEYLMYGDNCLSDPIHFLFLNRQGAWDTYTFDRKNTKRVRAQKKTYAQGGIRNTPTYTKFSSQARQVYYDGIFTESVMAQSDWVDENDVPIIEDMFQSSHIYLIKDNYEALGTDEYYQYLIPVLVTDVSFEEYKQKYQKIYQYTFNFEYNPITQKRINL